jgi:hypothetical protein
MTKNRNKEEERRWVSHMYIFTLLHMVHHKWRINGKKKKLKKKINTWAKYANCTTAKPILTQFSSDPPMITQYTNCGQCPV